MGKQPIDAKVRLTFRQRVSRILGMWWDVINVAIGMVAILFLFLSSALALMTGNADFLPFGDFLWASFTSTVSSERQAEMGLGLLGVTVSGGTAAALYLIRVGTARWATCRRVGHTFGLYAESIWRGGHTSDPESSRLLIQTFSQQSLTIYDSVNACHPAVQKEFEKARVMSLLISQKDVISESDLGDFCAGLFVAALISNKEITIHDADDQVVRSINSQLLRHLS